MTTLTWGEYLRKAGDFLDSERVLTVKHIVVETWGDLVIEVKNSYRDAVDVIKESERKPTTAKVDQNTYVENVDVFGDPEPVLKMLTREDKIAFIQNYLMRVSTNRGSWFSSPVPYSDEDVSDAYRYVVEQSLRQKVAEKESLNKLDAIVDGDRFKPFNSKDYWDK